MECPDNNVFTIDAHLQSVNSQRARQQKDNSVTINIGHTLNVSIKHFESISF